MTPEQQRIAIAEACGKAPKLDWQVMNPDESASCLSGTKSECEEWLSDHLSRFPDSRYSNYHVGAWKRYPDYLNDLSAMHEAEREIKGTEQIEWFHQMQRVLNIAQTTYNAFTFCHATAAQRAEAFLKTKGLWKL